jgi:hemolysin activation/secretion protein
LAPPKQLRLCRDCHEAKTIEAHISETMNTDSHTIAVLRWMASIFCVTVLFAASPLRAAEVQNTPPSRDLAGPDHNADDTPVLLMGRERPTRMDQPPALKVEAEPWFDILEFVVEGNSKLDDVVIERAVTPFLGEAKTFADIEGARAALENKYHDAGYLTVLVNIPEGQDAATGTIVLAVVEGEIDRLRVRGAEYTTASGIKARVPELAEGKVPNFTQVQRELDALNRGNDLKVTPVLKPGRAPGTVAIQLEVEDELPLHGSLDFSNRQSPNTTSQRLTGNLRYDNLWQLHHSASLTLQTSPQKTDEVRVGALTYVTPIGDDGDALALYTVVSRSTLASLSNSPGLGLLGNTNIYGLRYAMPLPGVEKFSHSLSMGIDYKDVQQSVVVTGTPGIATPITYAPLVAAYNGGWTGNQRNLALDATGTIGLRGLLGNNPAEFEAKRHGANADFAVLRLGLRYNENVGRWSLTAKLDSQFASGPLVTNEAFTAGGAESVRGYLESERIGDAAFRYSFEARTPRLPLSGKLSQLNVNGIGFYEGARLRTFQPVFPQTDVNWLRGTGLGLRVSGYHGLSLDVDWARALHAGDITRVSDNRIHARLMMEF